MIFIVLQNDYYSDETTTDLGIGGDLSMGGGGVADCPIFFSLTGCIISGALLLFA